MTIEKKVEEISNGYIKTQCDEWNLDEDEIKEFFLTAESFITGAEMSFFDIYPCKIYGYLLQDNVKREYSINLGGSAFIYGFGSEQQGYGCWEGACLKYVDYIPYEED